MDGEPKPNIARIDGLPVAYWRLAGPHGAARVLMIHGLGASHHIWQPLWRTLPPGLDVLTIDLPGAGATPPQGEKGPTAIAALMLKLAGEIGVGKIDAVVGHSLGGSVALEMGLQEPARVRGLMIINAAPSLPLWTRLGLRAPGMRRILALPELAPRQQAAIRLFTQMYLWGIFGERRVVTNELVDGYVRLAQTPGYHTNMAASLAGFARHSRALSELAKLRMPVSIVWGERDPLFGIAIAERLARAIPQAALQRLPRAGHCPPQECPELVAPLLMELLARVARARARARAASGAQIS